MEFLKRMLLVMILIVIGVTMGTRQAQALTLPDPNTPINGIPVASKHGDFYSYSLPILAYLYDPAHTGPGNPYYVASGPGQIMYDIVIATGANGQEVKNNPVGMDDAFDTPAENTTFAFSTGTSPDPGGAGESFGGSFDRADSWDSTLNALISYLDGSDLLFFFNHNETGGEADLYAWGEVRIVDMQGVLPTKYFYFTDAVGIPGVPTESPYNMPAQYVKAPSDICVATASGTECFSHNLGENQAAYAIVSPELNAGLAGWYADGYDIFQGDFRMAALNGGSEQLFIQKGSHVTITPEPATMILLGGGLIGLAGLRRKK